jgi:hypothetical protein
MALSLSSVARLSSDLVDARFPEVCIAGVLPGTGESNRVELIVTVGGGEEPHRLMFNLTRVNSDAFERELDTKLGDALAHAHR